MAVLMGCRFCYLEQHSGIWEYGDDGEDDEFNY